MQSESESDITTPLTPQGGNTVGLTVTKKKRRSREEIFSPYSPETKNLVNEILKTWPRTRPGNKSPINPDIPLLANRLDVLLHTPNLTSALLIGAGRRYLDEHKDFPHAPEFFFGPGKNGEPPWKAYARMEFHERQKQLALAQSAGGTQ
jgi:hypothetical protein